MAAGGGALSLFVGVGLRMGLSVVYWFGGLLWYCCGLILVVGGFVW